MDDLKADAAELLKALDGWDREEEKEGLPLLLWEESVTVAVFVHRGSWEEVDREVSKVLGGRLGEGFAHRTEGPMVQLVWELKEEKRGEGPEVWAGRINERLAAANVTAMAVAGEGAKPNNHRYSLVLLPARKRIAPKRWETTDRALAERGWMVQVARRMGDGFVYMPVSHAVGKEGAQIPALKVWGPSVLHILSAAVNAQCEVAAGMTEAFADAEGRVTLVAVAEGDKEKVKFGSGIRRILESLVPKEGAACVRPIPVSREGVVMYRLHRALFSKAVAVPQRFAFPGGRAALTSGWTREEFEVGQRGREGSGGGPAGSSSPLSDALAAAVTHGQGGEVWGDG